MVYREGNGPWMDVCPACSKEVQARLTKNGWKLAPHAIPIDQRKDPSKYEPCPQREIALLPGDAA